MLASVTLDRRFQKLHIRSQLAKRPVSGCGFVHGHCGTHNGSLVGVLHAYNGHLTLYSGHDVHGNGHVQANTRLRHIKHAMHGSVQTKLLAGLVCSRLPGCSVVPQYAPGCQAAV